MDALDDVECLRDKCFISDSSRFYLRKFGFCVGARVYGRINRRLILQ